MPTYVDEVRRNPKTAKVERTGRREVIGKVPRKSGGGYETGTAAVVDSSGRVVESTPGAVVGSLAEAKLRENLLESQKKSEQIVPAAGSPTPQEEMFTSPLLNRSVTASELANWRAAGQRAEEERAAKAAADAKKTDLFKTDPSKSRTPTFFGPVLISSKGRENLGKAGRALKSFADKIDAIPESGRVGQDYAKGVTTYPLRAAGGQLERLESQPNTENLKFYGGLLVGGVTGSVLKKAGPLIQKGSSYLGAGSVVAVAGTTPPDQLDTASLLGFTIGGVGASRTSKPLFEPPPGPRPSKFSIPAVEAVRKASAPSNIVDVTPPSGGLGREGAVFRGGRRVSPKSKVQKSKESTGRAFNPNQFKATSADNPSNVPNIKFERVRADRYEAVKITTDTPSGVRRTEILKAPKTGAGRDVAVREFDYNFASRESTFKSGLGTQKGPASVLKNPTARPPSQLRSSNDAFGSQDSFLVVSENTVPVSFKRVPQKIGPKVDEGFSRPRIEKLSNDGVVTDVQVVSNVGPQVPGVRQRTGRESVVARLRESLSRQKRDRTQLVVVPVPSVPSVQSPPIVELVSRPTPSPVSDLVVSPQRSVPSFESPSSSLSFDSKSRLTVLLDPRQSSGSVVRQDFSIDAKLIPAQSQDVVSIQVPAQSQDVGQVQDQLFDVAFDTLQRRREIVVEDSPSRPSDPFQVPGPTGGPRAIEPFKPGREPRNPVSRAPRVPEVPIVPALPKLPRVNSRQQYRVIVGKPGNKVFVDLGLGDENLILKGRDIVRRTAAASLTVKGANSSVLPRLGADFAVSKSRKDTFIQVREKRISSGGEKREITDLGISSSKKKNPLRDKSSFNNALKLVRAGFSLRGSRRR